MTTSRLSGIRRFGALLAGLGLLVSVVTIVLLAGDYRSFVAAGSTLRWGYVAGMAGLSLANHLVRYWRWEVLLRHVAAVSFRRTTAVLLFSAGSLLIFTPGRMGEVAKSVYARDYLRIPISNSLPILVAERLTDVIVMAVLATLGLSLIGKTPSLLIASVMLLAVAVVLILRASIIPRLLRWKVFQHLGSTTAGEFLQRAGGTQASLFTHRAIGPNFALGTAAWMIEITIFFLSLAAVGNEPTSRLFTLSVAFFPLASLAGSLSFLPAGLGVTEGGLTALGVLIGKLPEGSVMMAALITRMAIMGMVIAAGVASIMLLRRIAPAPAR